MKRLYMLILVFAVFTGVASSAYAEDLLWLVNGQDFEAGFFSAETEGELKLTRLNKEGGVQQGEIFCQAIFDGTITNPAAGKGTDEITKVLDVEQREVAVDGPTSLSQQALSCEVIEDKGDFTFCKTGGAGSALVWPANLPWLTELVLMTVTEWLDILGVGAAEGSEPGYEVECTTLLGVKASDLCEGIISAFVLVDLEGWPGTEALGAHSEFTPASGEALCVTAGGGELVAGFFGLGITWAIVGNLNRLETDVSETP